MSESQKYSHFNFSARYISETPVSFESYELSGHKSLNIYKLAIEKVGNQKFLFVTRIKSNCKIRKALAIGIIINLNEN